MWKILNPKGYMNLLMASHNGDTIATILLLKYKDTVIYQNGCSDTKYLWLKPNHLLLWKAIELAKIEGYKWFNFGKSAPSDEGLIKFKGRWGTKKYTLPHYYYPKGRITNNNIEMTKAYKFANYFFGNMPELILKKIGEFTYRHIA